jgi:hypothetical protein
VGGVSIKIEHSKINEGIEFTIDLNKYGIFNYHVGRTDISNYIDSVVIYDKTYYHVHKIENSEYPNLYIIYNNKYGIIQINSTNNKIWKRI